MKSSKGISLLKTIRILQKLLNIKFMKKARVNRPEISKLVWFITSFVIVFLSILLLVYSHDLTIWAKPSTESIILFAFLEFLAGLFFAFAFIFGAKQLDKKNIIWLIIIIGIAARLILIPSSPVLEDDYNRYIWDGAVLTTGINPYKYSPLEIQTDSVSVNPEISELHALSNKAGVIFQRINFPEVRTIYPMASQVFFAASYVISGWNINGWRIISFLMDIITLLLLLIILKKLNLPQGWIAIYWLNPIVLHQFFNAGHMDVLIFPFILGAIYFLLNEKEKSSSVFLAIAAGIKIWPIILFPIMYRKYFKQKFNTILLILIPSVIIALLYTPVFLSKLDNSLGFIRYAGNWYNNDAVFRAISLAINEVASLVSTQTICDHCIARYVVSVIYLIILLFIFKKPAKNNIELLEKLLLAVTFLFFLSPTQFPWYYTWILPILVLRPKISLILYPIFLPLYQLQYLWQNVVWFEHLPIIIFFIFELKNKDKFRLFNYFKS